MRKPCKHVELGVVVRYANGKCVICAREHSAAWRKANPELHKERYRAWAKANPERKKEYERARAKRYRERKRINSGMIFAEGQTIQGMLAAQDGKCAICGVEIGGSGHGTHVDHCHESGKVRGLLCMPCNVGIGRLKDDPGLLRAAARYLEAHTASGGSNA